MSRRACVLNEALLCCLLTSLISLGCKEEIITLAPSRLDQAPPSADRVAPTAEDQFLGDEGGTGGAGGIGGAGGMGGAGGAPPPGGQAPIGYEEVFEPDLDRFGEEILPLILDGCAAGAGCHGPGASNGFALPFDLLPDPLDDASRGEAFDVVTAHVNWEVPEESLLLIKTRGEEGSFHGSAAGEIFSSESEEYQRLYQWIDDALYERPIYAEMGPMGGDPNDRGTGGVGGSRFPELCASAGDPLNRADGRFYEEFESRINTLLLSNCTNGDCHGSSSRGFWLLEATDACSVPANFSTAVLYTDFQEIDRSPILTEPLDPEHTGYGVFLRGQSNEDFIELRTWLGLSRE